MSDRHSEGKHPREPFSGVWKLLTILTLVLVAANLYITAGIANNSAFINGNMQEGSDSMKAQEPQNSPPPQQPAPPPPPTAQVSADDDAVMGNPDAPVEIIEFSDYQCPFCARFFEQTLPQLEQNYIDAGKVKLIYRDFPLSFHQDAQKAAEAAECAGDQGKYWEMHDRIFGNQQSIGVDSLKQYAQQIGLDTGQFNSCLDSGKYAEEVQKDFSDGQAAGVSGTPTFFINGVKVVGAQPYSVFEQAIEQMLA